MTLGVRLNWQPRLFGAFNPIEKERVPKWQAFWNICTCANTGPDGKEIQR